MTDLNQYAFAIGPTNVAHGMLWMYKTASHVFMISCPKHREIRL